MPAIAIAPFEKRFNYLREKSKFREEIPGPRIPLMTTGRRI